MGRRIARPRLDGGSPVRRRPGSLIAAATVAGVLTSQAAGAAASGHYLYSESAGAGLLVVAGMPPLPLGAVYQVWLEDSLRAVSGGVFTADATGAQSVLVETTALLLPRRISVRVAEGGAEATPEGLLVLSGEIVR